MSEQFQTKILVMAGLAALIGMDGFFSMIDRKIRDTGNENEYAIQVQTNPAGNGVINTPVIDSEFISSQNEILMNEEPEPLNNEEAAPLIYEELEFIDLDEDQTDNLRNAVIAPKTPHQHQKFTGSLRGGHNSASN